MNNNKSHKRTDSKSNAELRKMFPQNGGDIGIIHGEKIGSNIDKMTKRSKFPRHDEE